MATTRIPTSMCITYIRPHPLPLRWTDCQVAVWQRGEINSLTQTGGVSQKKKNHTPTDSTWQFSAANISGITPLQRQEVQRVSRTALMSVTWQWEQIGYGFQFIGLHSHCSLYQCGDYAGLCRLNISPSSIPWTFAVLWSEAVRESVMNDVGGWMAWAHRLLIPALRACGICRKVRIL